MNSAARKDHQLSALEVFRERCAARASLFANNMMDLIEAVDGLQQAAERTGLVDELGQDGVQRLMATAFAPVRRLDDG
jgi:hypothetical protein